MVLLRWNLTARLYKCSDYYAPETEGALRWNDPDIGIKWPLQGNPILSEKDTVAPELKEF
jgi:dTDP-4-dehydrorhamnose 3,5-epimerase